MGRRLSALKLNRRCRCVGEREKQAMGVVSGPRAAFGISGALGLSREPQSGLGNIPPPFCFVLFSFLLGNSRRFVEVADTSTLPSPLCFTPFPNGRLTFFWGGLVRFLFFGGKKEKKSYWVYFGVLCCFFFCSRQIYGVSLRGNRCLCGMVWANLSRITTTENIAVWEMLELSMRGGVGVDGQTLPRCH